MVPLYIYLTNSIIFSSFFLSFFPIADALNEDINTDELDRWPQALLSIGTFGNKNREEPKNYDEKNDSCSSQDVSDFTLEEFNKIQEMLKSLFTMKPKLGTTGMDQQLSRILNCPSRFEIIRASFQKLYDEFEKNGGGNISPDMKIILSKAKDMLTNKSRTIKQKSLRFVLKKIFLGRGSSMSGPNFTNPMPESRMEKVYTFFFKQLLVIFVFQFHSISLILISFNNFSMNKGSEGIAS